jgi:hypothetical protein
MVYVDRWRWDDYMHCGLAINCCSLDYWRCRANASKSSERLLDLTTRIVLHPRATRLLTLQFSSSSSSSSSSTSFKQQLVRFASVSAMHAWSGLSAVCLPSVFYRGSWSETRSNWSHVSATLRTPYKTCSTTADRVELLTSDQTGHQANQPHNNTPLTSRLHVTRGHAHTNIVLTFLCGFASFCPHDT